MSYKIGNSLLCPSFVIRTIFLVNVLVWLIGSSAAAAAGLVAGPYGSTYDFELLTGEHASGQNNLYRYSTGSGSFTLHFDGSPESLPSYCCGLNTTPLVTESFTSNGDGTSTVEIIATSPNGSDLYPSGLTGTGNVLLTDAALRIGYFSGSTPLTWNPPHTVLSATVDMRSSEGSIIGGPTDLDPATFFGAPGSWDGNIAVIFHDLAGRNVNRVDLRIVVPSPASTAPCEPGADHLCLNSSRFRVEATWKKATGETGSGHAVGLTADTGYFWFFSDSNVEAVIKVLDACSLNGSFWVFAAGLTNVQTTITVTDSLTNTMRVYTNPLNTPFQPIQDTSAFSTCGAQSATNNQMVTFGVAPPMPAKSISTQSDLLLRGGRFLVHTVWTKPTGETGVGTGVALTSDTGYFWFFSGSNVELIIKVLDGCALNRRNWIFAGGLTNVKVVVTVTDTLTGDIESFTNPQGKAFVPIQSTQTDLISTTCLPRCAGQSFPSATIKQAVDKAIAGLKDPFGDDFGRVMARISDQLLCGILDESAASPGKSRGRLPGGSVILPETAPIYDGNVDYCGKGDSTNSWLVAPTGDSCVNRACHDHDLCYQHSCVATQCYFSPHSFEASHCDSGLISACLNCQLGFVDRIVCILVDEIPVFQSFNPFCSGAPCADGQVCNQASGQCEGGNCQYSLDESSHFFEAGSGIGDVFVTETANPDCTWTAVSSDNWIRVLPPSSQTTSVPITYVVAANPDSEARAGAISIANMTLSVTQAGSGSCSYSLNATGEPFESGGGPGSVDVTTPSGCQWTAVSNNNWIKITSGNSGTGNGAVDYSVDANPDASPRNGTLTIAGLTFTITEDGLPDPCNTQQFSGGDTPETHAVAMGRSAGTFIFDYSTYSIPDQMVVLYEGKTLFDTGCVGESNSVTLSYSGHSTVVTVEVTPNCSGPTSGTEWDFTVECPTSGQAAGSGRRAKRAGNSPESHHRRGDS